MIFFLLLSVRMEKFGDSVSFEVISEFLYF